MALPTWLLVAWRAAHFSGGLVWAVLAASVIVGGAVAYGRRRALASDFREHWRSWLAVEGVFLAAFTAFLLLRAFNPDLWHHPQGGEKPMSIRVPHGGDALDDYAAVRSGGSAAAA